MAEFGIVLLAAGNASRMGRPKQLLDFGGLPLIRHAAAEAIASGCGPVIVVCGSARQAIEEALAGLPVELAHNRHWVQGMGTSIQCGLRQLEHHAVEGAVLTLADQPLLDRRTFRHLVDLQRQSGQSVITSSYGGTVGVPVLFTRSLFGELMELPPEQGCKGVIQRNLARAAQVDCPDAMADVDTPEDYERVLAEFLRRRTTDSALVQAVKN